MTANLQNYETDERYLLEQLYSLIPSIKEYIFTSGRICYDSIVTTTKNEQIIVEAKVRKTGIDQYPDYILQVDKLQGLIKRANQNKCSKIYYINFFTESDITKRSFIIFDLTPRIREWQIKKPMVEKRLMNAMTCESTTDKTMKNVIMLKYNPGTDSKGSFSLN